jgi:hypothetical protein
VLPGGFGLLGVVVEQAEGGGVAGVRLDQVMDKGVLRNETGVEFGQVRGGERAGDQPEHDGVVGVGFGSQRLARNNRVVGDPFYAAEREGESAEVDYGSG